MLIQRGYDVNSLLENKTPLEIAIGNDKKEIAIYLLQLADNNFDVLSSYDVSRYNNSTFKYLEQQSQISSIKKLGRIFDFMGLRASDREANANNSEDFDTREVVDINSKIQEFAKVIISYSENLQRQAMGEINSRIKEYAKAVVGLPCTDRAKIFWKIKMLRLSSGVEDIYIKIIYLLRKLSPEAVLKVFEFVGASLSTIPMLSISPEELESIKIVSPKQDMAVERSTINFSEPFKAMSISGENIPTSEPSKKSLLLYAG